MVEKIISVVRSLLLLVGLLAFPSVTFAHQLDEYLQATLVAIEPGRVLLKINLTPGLAVASPILAAIDRDNDGSITANEATGYAELLKHDLVVRLDGRAIVLTLSASEFPSPAELRTGLGIIRLEFSVPSVSLAAGPHRLNLENHHLPKVSVYLINASRPGSPSIEIAQQNRNETQSSGEIDFEYHPPPNLARAAGILAAGAGLLGFVLFAGARKIKRNADN